MEKPILFSTDMVQAILSGKKTQTRRIIKNKYDNADIEWFTNKYGTRLIYAQNDVKVRENPDGSKSIPLRACEEIKWPYKVGDILWVRETWCQDDLTPEDIYYKANYRDREAKELFNDLGLSWKPSIHMPRAAARLFLKVTGIRPERLQDIDDKNAEYEGIRGWTKDGSLYKYGHIEPGDKGCIPWRDMPLTAKEAFQNLWDSIYKNWNENPWVWVIEFEKMEG